MTTRYDPDVLQQYADQLYRRARWTTLRYACLGFLIGWIGSAILFSALSVGHSSAGGPIGAAVIIGGLVALGAFSYGQSKAFQLRLEAQRTLCQLEIERNTRAAPKTGPLPTSGGEKGSNPKG